MASSLHQALIGKAMRSDERMAFIKSGDLITAIVQLDDTFYQVARVIDDEGRTRINARVIPPALVLNAIRRMNESAQEMAFA